MVSYKLHYWPQIPGRGEYIRLAFEYAQVPYEENNDVSSLSVLLADAPPAHFAVPILEIRHTEGEGGSVGAGGESSYLSQTPAILGYLSSTLPAFSSSSSSSSTSDSILRSATEAQLTLTVLDLSNEAHDTHHPIASALYYEEQREEALRRAEDFRKARVPKFLECFERALKRGEGRLLDRGDVEGEGKKQKAAGVADLTLWQVLSGLSFAFPRMMASLQRSGKFPHVFRFKEDIAELEPIKTYLHSGRRKEFWNGVFRHYPELDGEVSLE